MNGVTALSPSSMVRYATWIRRPEQRKRTAAPPDDAWYIKVSKGLYAAMIDQAKRTWQAFKRSQPGYRFQERYNRRQQTTSGPFDPKNLLYVAAGILIVVVGVLLAPIPGPGGIIAFVGLALIGSEFLPIARALDWGELRIRGLVRWVDLLT